jgi:hypothetical protein
MAKKRKKAKAVKDQRMNRRMVTRTAAGGHPPRTPAEPTPHSRQAEVPPQGVTTEQLEAILNVLNMLIDHADRVASKAQVAVVAARDLLVSKGLVTEEEWDAAVDRVESGQATLFAMDPDVQSTMDEIRRLLDPEEPNAGAPEEGGEA